MVCEVWLTLEKFTMNDEWTIVDVARTREDAVDFCRACESATDTDIEYRVLSCRESDGATGDDIMSGFWLFIAGVVTATPIVFMATAMVSATIWRCVPCENGKPVERKKGAA